MNNIISSELHHVYIVYNKKFFTKRDAERYRDMVDRKGGLDAFNRGRKRKIKRDRWR